MSLANATRSESTKLLTTAMWWILGLILLVYVALTATGIGFVFSASAAGELPGGSSGGHIPTAGLPALLYSLASSIGYVFPLLIGTLMVTAEFRHQTLTPTFLATPRRGQVLTAKALVGIVIGVAYAIVALVAAVGPGAGFLAGFGQDAELGSSDTWAMFGRIVIAFVLWVLIGLGVGALVRNQVAAVVVVLAFTQFVEPIGRVAAAFVKNLDKVMQFLPGAASDALVGSSIYTTMGAQSGSASAQLDWWAGGLVLLAYAVVLLILGYATSWRRDVE
ncbi:ABC transporter permease subunit [Microbacterium sp.]|uniref:ABC transporter permease subunit n=1 Tax=Microbacterium sp. TaxID=51671 RepID=UPI003A8E388C